MKLLIIGKIPPPIGGVTIHVQRLLENLDKINYPYIFINLNFLNIPIITKQIIFSSKIHLHSSNTFFKLLITIICFFLNKKLIITNHGNLNRYGNLKDFLDKLSIKWCYTAIVLNDYSLYIAKKINKRTVKISSFLPPVKENLLEANIQADLLNIKMRYLKICCTNASGYHTDKNGNDIYGIEELIKEFNKLKDYALIISDPSGDYSSKFSNIANSNILFINEKHSYYEVIKFCDITIRNTTTDGDSVSVKESLYLNKLTLATSCVSRPEGTIQYDKFNISLLNNSNIITSNNLNGFNELVNLYNKI